MSEENQYTTPPPPPPPAASAPTQASDMDQRNWAMFTHLSALLGLITGVGFILGPLVLWLIKKDQMPQVNEAGKEAVNFQLTMLIAFLVSWVLVFLLIGFLLIPLVVLFDVVMSIIAAAQTSNGTRYRYPLTIRFIN